MSAAAVERASGVPHGEPVPALEVRSLSHRYASSAGEVQALADASLQVEEGEFVSLVGPSGCGKTTLLRIAAGLLDARPGSGARSATVRVFSEGPGHARRERWLGLVQQEPGLLPWLSVESNVRLATELAGVRADLPALLERVGT